MYVHHFLCRVGDKRGSTFWVATPQDVNLGGTFSGRTLGPNMLQITLKYCLEHFLCHVGDKRGSTFWVPTPQDVHLGGTFSGYTLILIIF